MGKLSGFVEAHPKLSVALAGALLALQLFELSETIRLFGRAIGEAHRAEVASDLARAASESLGG